VQRRGRIALGGSCASDLAQATNLAQATKLGDLDLGVLAGERDGAQPVELRADFVEFTTHVGELTQVVEVLFGQFGASLLQGFTEACDLLWAVEQAAAVTHGASANPASRRSRRPW